MLDEKKLLDATRGYKDGLNNRVPSLDNESYAKGWLKGNAQFNKKVLSKNSVCKK